jgi:hypothetical protein
VTHERCDASRSLGGTGDPLHGTPALACWQRWRLTRCGSHPTHARPHARTQVMDALFDSDEEAFDFEED